MSQLAGMLPLVSKYEPWRVFFESAPGTYLELRLTELEELIQGPLPNSARNHPAWWSGQRNHAVWQESGWVASPDLVDQSVVFRKRGGTRPRDAGRLSQDRTPTGPINRGARLVLIGCVKTKVGHPAPAKDLYDSPLWRKRRRYAESTGMPWVILSAEHGMVDPDTVLDPYDRYLGSEPAAYRREWAELTAERVLRALRERGLRAVEIHAGAAYVNSGLKTRLENSGVDVFWLVEGMPIGKQLGWYS